MISIILAKFMPNIYRKSIFVLYVISEYAIMFYKYVQKVYRFLYINDNYYCENITVKNNLSEKYT